MSVRSSAPTRRRDEDEPEDLYARPIKLPAKRRRLRWDRVPAVLLGWAILGLWWLVGGRWTIDGLPLLLNEVFAFFRVPIALAPIRAWQWYVALCWLPFIISFVEHRYAPWRRLAWSVIMVWVVVVWLVASGVDLGSTWLAMIHPPPDAYPLTRQVAAIKPLAFVWSVATTFAPEIGIAMLWRWLRE
jgi:hypothetical protein